MGISNIHILKDEVKSVGGKKPQVLRRGDTKGTAKKSSGKK